MLRLLNGVLALTMIALAQIRPRLTVTVELIQMNAGLVFWKACR